MRRAWMKCWSAWRKSWGRRDRIWCDKEIEEKEVMAAIEGSRSGKSPGSDGIGIEWYKVYKKEVAPILVEVYKVMERTGKYKIEW